MSRHCRILFFVAIALLCADVEAATDERSRDRILADLAATPLPVVDVPRTSDPTYARELAHQRDIVRQKRAALVLELYRVDPDAPDIEGRLSERWQTMAQDQNATGAVSEMSGFLGGRASKSQKLAAAFLRGQIIMQYLAHDTDSRLAAFDEFRKYVGNIQETGDATRTMLARLLYLAARFEKDSGPKKQLLDRVVREYPDSPSARVVLGAQRRQEAVGKVMELKFNDAISGRPIDLADFRGKVVVVDFWAAWCTDCAADMPYMKKTYEAFKEKGVEFIGVSLDVPEDEGGLKALRTSVQRNQLTWPQYYQGKEWDAAFSFKWGIFSVPTVFVLDRDGRIVSSDATDKLESILPELLNRPRSDSQAASRSTPQ